MTAPHISTTSAARLLGYRSTRSNKIAAGELRAQRNASTGRYEVERADVERLAFARSEKP